MRYCLILILSLAAAVLSAASAAAATGTDKPFWVCAGYFEKQADTAVASHGIRIYRERFLATKTGAVRRAMFVFPVAYHVMRDHLRSQTRALLGEASFTAYDSFDLGADMAASGAPGQPLQPGDQVAALPAGAAGVKTAPAARMTTKPYNTVPSKSGRSELHLMVFDGAKITGTDSTLVVAWRYDSAEEWGTGASGSLLSFGRHRTGNTFVTSAEFKLMERLRELYRTPFTIFPLMAEGGLLKNEAALTDARAWLKTYDAKPSDELQANRPGGCG